MDYNHIPDEEKVLRLPGLSDLPAIHRLVGQGTVLDLECVLTEYYRPRWALWATPLYLMWPAGIITYMQQDRNGSGLVQVYQHRARREGWVLFVAPCPYGDQTALGITLLTLLGKTVGQQGIHRLFAAPAEDHPAVATLTQAGFTTYAAEEIFFHPDGQIAQTDIPSGIRLQTEADAWDIARLYSALTPLPVQQAEGLSSQDWGIEPARPVLRSECGSYVLEEQGEVVGYLRLKQGQRAWWARLMVHPQASDTSLVIKSLLAVTSRLEPRPVYCAVREYQGGLREVLSEHGFQPIARRLVMVKHTLVYAREPVRSLVPALEKRAGAPVTTIQTPIRYQRKAS